MIVRFALDPHRIAAALPSSTNREDKNVNKRISRPGVREGYDRWSSTYDSTPNPLVALDRRHTQRLLAPQAGERILDAGCGTGAHLRAMAKAKSTPIGVDFSIGMLRVARESCPRVSLVQADLNRGVPLAPSTCDAALCSLVSEHITALPDLMRDLFTVVRPGGRLVFSAFHPAIANSGVEANFEEDGVEYRLGAERYSVADYLTEIEDAGFRELQSEEHCGDTRLSEEIPGAGKYLDKTLLLTVAARRPLS